ncbi:MAG TPA: excinuclease ABC subunit C [Chloroflexi bacterium]|nr:excinuclease ABC subunit C [Chloroflexota bacterium]
MICLVRATILLMVTSHDSLKQNLSRLPNEPGCYLMKDKSEQVLYVGKATNIKKRVQSYFYASKQHSSRTQSLVSKIHKIDWIIQNSEIESLLLEHNLISTHKPKYNVRWKDDKQYPYIKIHWNDPFPKVTVVRKRPHTNDGHKYFGPYTNVSAVHKTLSVLRKVFPYLTCDRNITGNDARACLYWDIKLCMAPCIGECNKNQYRTTLNDMSNFLNGRSSPLIKRLNQEMRLASKSQHYERAALIRDQLQALQNIVAKQEVISDKKIDLDIIGFARIQNDACIQVFFIRLGKIIGRDYYLLETKGQQNDPEILSAFVKHFYHLSSFVPSKILLPEKISDSSIVEEWLHSIKTKGSAKLLVPQRGSKRRLVQMANQNALTKLKIARDQWSTNLQKQTQSLKALQKALSLPKTPNRIECYDISHTQGDEITGSMVVFVYGKPLKSHYRKFVIRSIQGQDDYASMQEVLSRRFKQWSTSQKSLLQTKDSFYETPDFLLIDGGKGHLNIALKTLRDFGVDSNITVAAIAKQYEEVFMSKTTTPIKLDPRSPAFFLLQRIRDEAHRFALQHHRVRRRKTIIYSELDNITGIGPKRRKALLKKFGSIDNIRKASFSDIMSTDNMTRTSAQAIKDQL